MSDGSGNIKNQGQSRLRAVDSSQELGKEEQTMQRVISISNPQQPSTPLGERLDATINETSNDIGSLIGELVNRSLKVGVSDLGDSLAEFAEEQVDQAIQTQMPAISEAADTVAQSAAKLVVQRSVAELHEEINSQKQLLETKIEAAEASAVDRSRTHIAEAVSEVRVSIDETRNLAIQGQDTSEKKIQLLRERGKQTWQKFQGEFASINAAYDRLRDEHLKLRDQHESLVDKHSRLVDKVALFDQTHQLQSQRTQEQLSTIIEQNRMLEERLATLEQPRGIKGLFAKLRGGNKTANTQAPPSRQGLETPSGKEEFGNGPSL